jgi:hypothetical protein
MAELCGNHRLTRSVKAARGFPSEPARCGIPEREVATEAAVSVDFTRLVALFHPFGIYCLDKKAIFRDFARAPRSWLATYILIRLFSAADLKMWLATLEDAFLVASQPTS